MKYLWSITILLAFCNVALVRPQGKRISLGQISVLDSLLVQLDTAQVREYIQNDSLTTQEYFLTTSCDWDSIKTDYTNLLYQLESWSLSTDSLKNILLLESMRTSENKFQIRYAGVCAENAFVNLNKTLESGNIKEAYIFYVIANFLRRNHINNEKLRVLNIADQVETILQNNKAQLEPLAQERGIVEKHHLLKRRLKDADDFIERYKLEDKTAPVFQCIVPTGKDEPKTMVLDKWLDKRFEKYGIELRRQQNILELEEGLKFKEIHYAVGVGIGGLFALKEFSPPYLQLFIWENGSTLQDMQKETNEVLGCSASMDIAWYIKDYFALEACFSYSEAKRDNLTYISGFSKFTFKSISPIKHYSYSIIGNYLLRVKTGIRPLVGAGINYFTTSLSKENTFDYIDNNLIRFKIVSLPTTTESMRIVFRIGAEYIPSDKSNLSCSLLIDGLFNVVSPQKESPPVVIPSIRLSWLF